MSWDSVSLVFIVPSTYSLHPDKCEGSEKALSPVSIPPSCRKQPYFSLGCKVVIWKWLLQLRQVDSQSMYFPGLWSGAKGETESNSMKLSWSYGHSGKRSSRGKRAEAWSRDRFEKRPSVHSSPGAKIREAGNKYGFIPSTEERDAVVVLWRQGKSQWGDQLPEIILFPVCPPRILRLWPYSSHKHKTIQDARFCGYVSAGEKSCLRK